MNSNEWVPSHVQVTVNQARELLLKNKNSSSEIFVVVSTDKEKFVTTSLPRSTDPVWDFTSEIPLMSLDTTLHLTVRQTGRLSDEFIGHITIPLSGFKLSSKQVTHWYKLGSRPGKHNLKLRGDLQVTIQLLSNWVQQFSEPSLSSVTPSSKKIYPIPGKGGIARAKSDLNSSPHQQRSSSLPNKSEILSAEKITSHSALRVKDKMSMFRRSFRKKNRSPVFQECADDFTSFSPPTHPRARSSTLDVTPRTPELTKNTSGASLSDVSTSESEGAHTPLKPSVQALFAEAAALEEEGKHGQERNKEGTKEEVDVKMSPATRYYSFRSKKKRWTMHTLPLSTLSPAHTPTDNALTPDNLEDETYVAKCAHSPKITRNRTQSSYLDDTKNSSSSLNTPLLYDSASDVSVTKESPERQRKREPESGYSTSSSLHKVKQLAVNDEAKVTPKREEKKLTRTKSLVSKPSSSPGKRTVSPTPRTRHQVQARKDLVSPTASKQRSRMSSTSSDVNSLKGELKTRTPVSSRPSSLAVTPNRSPALSRKPSGNGRPLSKATRSVSLREPAPARRRPKSMIESSRAREKPLKKAADKSVKKIESSQEAVAPSKELAKGLPVSSNTSVEIEEPTADVNKEDVVAKVVNGDKSKTNEGLNISQTDHSPESEQPLRGIPRVLSENKEHVEGVSQVVSNAQGSSEPKEQAEQVIRPESCPPSEESLSMESDTSSITSTAADDKKPKHTVAYGEKFKDGFKPVSLLPPSLMTYQSQTLPSRGKLTRHSSCNSFTTTERPSTVPSSQEAMFLQQRSATLRQSNRSPENIRVLHRRSMNISLLSSYHQEGLDSIPQSPPREINSLEDLNREQSVSRMSTTSTVSQESGSRPTTPATPNSVKYGGKTPGEIVSSAMRSRKASGGLRNAINRYQENRKQRRESQNTFKGQRGLQVEEECLDRSTSSAETSPSLRRNRSAASAFSNVIQNSLRRTKSHTPASMSRPVSMGNFDSTDGDSLPDLQQPSLKVPANSLCSINQSESLDKLSASSPQEDDSATLVESSIKSDTSARTIREDTPTLTESASVKTLTDTESHNFSVRRTSSPNPAGAVTGTHVRHTTCSSIGSEGIGSYTSEELSLDDLTHQDWSQWSKEDLVKELIHSKQRLKTTEEELKDVKTYLDNLLLRIMETNPSVLSTVRSS